MFRKHLLAGLLAAAAIPAFANAAPSPSLGEIQQRAQQGLAPVSAESPPTTSEVGQADQGSTSADRYVNLAELQQRGQLGRGAGGEGATDRFFAAHQREMNVGVSHIEASQVAARKLSTADRN